MSKAFDIDAFINTCDATLHEVGFDFDTPRRERHTDVPEQITIQKPDVLAETDAYLAALDAFIGNIALAS